MILLKDIIDEFMLSATDPDSLIYGTSRTLVLKHAKRCFESIMYASSPGFKIIQQTLPASKTLSWPIGAIDILRINYVDTDGKLIPIYENRRNPIAFEYVTDSEGDIIYDDNNNPLKASVEPSPSVATQQERLSPYDYFYGARFGIRGGESNGIGTFRYEPETQLFYFFDFPDDSKILFEYVTNPLLDKKESELSVSEYAREPLEAFIYYELIRWKSNVALGEKERARREYFHLLGKAKKKITLNAQRIGQALKKSRAFLAW